MDKLVVKGHNKLFGEVFISGAKNASLPILAATILADGTSIIKNIPDLQDIHTMNRLLDKLDIKTAMVDHTVTLINSGTVEHYEAPYDLVRTMRASILVLGPLLAKRKVARVSLPGGCAIGERPVDLHIAALEKMGAKISVTHGYIDAKCEQLKGCEFTFNNVTVTGTENIMMAASLAKGVTVLNNAAQEPEVVDLANCLISMGAKITGAGTSSIVIEGVDLLAPATYTVMPDRIEAGTILCAVAGTGGDVTVKNAPIKSLTAVIDKLTDAGIELKIINDTTIHIKSNGEIRAVDITTMPYPGFPTDMQAQFMALMTVAKGTSIINETIFENRFMHVAELKRMGADVTVKDSNAIVRGVESLDGTQVMASDLRASAGLVIAALMANNTSEIQRVYHLDRGYEAFEVKMSLLGADIKRVKGE